MLPLTGDKRRHRRQTAITPFAYHISLASPGIQIGITANISNSGMCIYSDINHNEGEIIEIRSSLPAASSRATVRWSKKDAADLFKMGLMFIE
jgi:PilZ domain